MKYLKPSIVLLASATQAIQSHDGTKPGNLLDLVFPGQAQTSCAAYEADE